MPGGAGTSESAREGDLQVTFVDVGVVDTARHLHQTANGRRWSSNRVPGKIWSLT